MGEKISIHQAMLNRAEAFKKLESMLPPDCGLNISYPSLPQWARFPTGKPDFHCHADPEDLTALGGLPFTSWNPSALFRNVRPASSGSVLNNYSGAILPQNDNDVWRGYSTYGFAIIGSILTVSYRGSSFSESRLHCVSHIKTYSLTEWRTWNHDFMSLLAVLSSGLKEQTDYERRKQEERAEAVEKWHRIAQKRLRALQGLVNAVGVQGYLS